MGKTESECFHSIFNYLGSEGQFVAISPLMRSRVEEVAMETQRALDDCEIPLARWDAKIKINEGRLVKWQKIADLPMVDPVSGLTVIRKPARPGNAIKEAHIDTAPLPTPP